MFPSTKAYYSKSCMKAAELAKKECNPDSSDKYLCHNYDDKCGFLWCKTYGMQPVERKIWFSSRFEYSKCYGIPEDRQKISSLVPDGTSCGEDKMCVKGSCTSVNFDPTSCEGVRCNVGHTCQEGKCVKKKYGEDPCDGKCKEFEVCKYGKCAIKPGTHICDYTKCPPNTKCINGNCVSKDLLQDPCRKCDDRYQECLFGQCQLKSTWFICSKFACPKDSFFCKDDVCQKIDRNEECRKTCNTVSSECKNGECVLKYGYSVCGDSYCTAKQRCVVGTCISNELARPNAYQPMPEKLIVKKLIDPMESSRGECLVYQVFIKDKCYNMPRIRVCRYVQCDVGEACVNDKCHKLKDIEGPCPDRHCGFGKHCLNNQCFFRMPVQKLCQDVECGEDEICRNAICVSKTEIKEYCEGKTCPTDETCVSGICIIPSNTQGCENVKCESTEICMFGSCIQRPPHYSLCYEVECSEDEVCNWEGKCVEKEKYDIKTMKQNVNDNSVGFDIPSVDDLKKMVPDDMKDLIPNSKAAASSPSRTQLSTGAIVGISLACVSIVVSAIIGLAIYLKKN